jgi:nitrous oxidase accessory protein
VERVELRNALFGILAEQCRGLVLRDNVIVGHPGKALGMRGDGIRLWEVRGARVEGNRIQDSRDLVVWYSPGNTFARNQVSGGRYGTHFMYSHGNRLEESRYVGNVVGVFAMYSRDLVLRGNLIAESRGAAGVGIGAKESGDLVVEDNWLIDNTVGIYLDNSPLQPDESNRFRGNALRFGEVGVVFHGPAAGNHFVANRFADHHVAVRVEGRGSAVEAEWRGNDFDDYAGYDFD